MGAALEIRSDLASPTRLRALARRERNPRTATRMLAIASELEGKSRAEAARLAGMELGPCQPALSSTRTMWRSRPARTFRAKPASSASKKGFERPRQRYQTASPLVGCTKATTCNHS